MTNKSTAYQLEFEPLLIRQILLDCDITQDEAARTIGISRPAMNLVINKGYVPKRSPKIRERIESYILNHKKTRTWLTDRGIGIKKIWEPTQEETRKVQPPGTFIRMQKTREQPAIAPGDPRTIIYVGEKEMLTRKTMSYFKIFQNPFAVPDEKSIFMSSEHRYIEEVMLDAARFAGFVAIVGEAQSGKSTMRKKIVIKLQKEDGVKIIYPQIIDKKRANASSLCDAIIQDISDETPKNKLEDKARQIQRLLLNRHKQGVRHVMIIEEAHDLTIETLRLLKRFYEIEDGFTKLLGIILIGQPELKEKLNEARHPEIREVIRRIQIAEIMPLDGNLKEYLVHKFKKVGADFTKIWTDDAIKMLAKRLTVKDLSGEVMSNSYPGKVEDSVAKAMNLACRMGAEKVTDEIVMEI